MAAKNIAVKMLAAVSSNPKLQHELAKPRLASNSFCLRSSYVLMLIILCIILNRLLKTAKSAISLPATYRSTNDLETLVF